MDLIGCDTDTWIGGSLYDSLKRESEFTGESVRVRAQFILSIIGMPITDFGCRGRTRRVAGETDTKDGKIRREESLGTGSWNRVGGTGGSWTSTVASTRLDG